MDKKGSKMGAAAEAYSLESGIRMTWETTNPGVLFYTANSFDGNIGKDGVIYQKHSGFCLEAQNYLDAINHKNFPSAILRAGETYK